MFVLLSMIDARFKKSKHPKKNQLKNEWMKSNVRRKTKSNQSWESPKEINILKKTLNQESIKTYHFEIQNPNPNSPTSYEQTHLKFVPIDGHENVG